MKRSGPRPCVCGCKALVRRSQSIALCKPAAARLKAHLREQVRVLSVDEYLLAFNRLYSSEDAVRAALLAAAS